VFRAFFDCSEGRCDLGRSAGISLGRPSNREDAMQPGRQDVEHWLMSEAATQTCLRLIANSKELLLRMIRHFELDRSAADDAVQAAWIEVAKRPHQRQRMAEAGQLRTWLRQVLSSKVMNLFRERARHPRSPLGDILGTVQEPLSNAEDPSVRLDGDELRTRLWKAISDLGVKEELNVRLLLMRFRDGLKTAAIAAATKLSPRQVRDRLRRTIAKLRKRLGVDAGLLGGVTPT
jgi:RNA polymerase sigma factor (sigma-70 family)